MVHDIYPTCPCQARQKPLLLSGSSTESSAPATSKNAVSLTPSNGYDSRRPHSPNSEYTQSIVDSSSLFERLVSGQESETGEAPPSYEIFSDGTSGHGQSSISVAVREVQLNVARRQKSGIFG